ncbi:D-amino acid aminotransferase [Pigmentiphaga sp. NML080357]|uniref:D-amino acid aminotransferase n=1 Tax=Pigmentiphaga sp. NML080357 TaxID=2008675 RepID=UPI000B40C940|nr:D-amino acid aminotransferase [Pigmentiphaga sp. NML080357]OVZ59296.1 D-amino acid aminotransferase [Pigmentiphaga sp. NML080357]
MIPGIAGDPPVYLNGEFTPLSQAKISVLDRGFIFGDGIYEVVPVYGRKPFRMAQHLARLARSLEAIRIPNPHGTAEWRELVGKLIDTSDAQDQFVYLQVTRGVAKRDHAFPAQVVPTVFGMTSPFARPAAALREQGVKAVTMPDERWLHCEIKSTSLLGNVLARQFAADRDALEVVMFRDGYLSEGSSSNIWVVKDGRLVAPQKNHLILEGIRYGFIEEMASAKGIPLEMRPVSQAEVEAADELMLSSATKEILPIVSLDGKPVGSGRPGPVYARLRQGYDEAIAAL